jgi:hypothetical protein
MPRGIYDRSKSKQRPLKQFCSKGHNVLICGREKSGNCKECGREYRRKRYKPHPRIYIKKQFCLRGHNTFICGRSKSGVCKDCQKLRNKGPKQLVQFCPKNHDTFIAGRQKGYCIQCILENRPLQKIRNKENKALKAEIISKIKSIPCMDCKIKYPPYVMQFDHRSGLPKFMDISTMVQKNFKLDKILKEIAKCDVVCANCHAIRTYKQKGVIKEKINMALKKKGIAQPIEVVEIETDEMGKIKVKGKKKKNP